MFNIPADRVYMRFYKSGRVLRVARAQEGLCMALYPTSKKGVYEGEAFQEVDDTCQRRPVPRSEVKDDIWLRLLDEEPVEKILKDCKEFAGYHVNLPVNDDPLDHLEHPTFRIAEDQTEGE